MGREGATKHTEGLGCWVLVRTLPMSLILVWGGGHNKPDLLQSGRNERLFLCMIQ